MNRTDIVPGNKDEKKHLSSTTVFVMELRQRIDSYFNLVIRNVRDRVPKTIGHFLVKKCQDKIQFHLYSEINKNSTLNSILGEHPAITQERDEMTKSLEVMKRATKVLQRDPDITNVISLDDKLEKDLREESKENRMRPPPQNRSRQPPPSSAGSDSMSGRPSPSPGAGEFLPPGGDGSGYDRMKRESVNPHMMRVQQQPNNAPLSQTQARPQQPRPAPQRSNQPRGGNAPADFGNLFGDSKS